MKEEVGSTLSAKQGVMQLVMKIGGLFLHTGYMKLADQPVIRKKLSENEQGSTSASHM